MRLDTAVLVPSKLNDGRLRNAMGQLMSVMDLHNESCGGVSPEVAPMESRQTWIRDSSCKCKRYLNWLQKELGRE